MQDGDPKMGKPRLSIYVRSDEQLRRLRSEAERSGLSLSAYITSMALLGVAARRKGFFLGPDGKVYVATESAQRSPAKGSAALGSTPMTSAPLTLATGEDDAQPPLPD